MCYYIGRNAQTPSGCNSTCQNPSLEALIFSNTFSLHPFYLPFPVTSELSILKVELWPYLSNLYHSAHQYCFPISFPPYFFFSCSLMDGPNSVKSFSVTLIYFSNSVFFTKGYYLVPHPSFLNPNPEVMSFSEPVWSFESLMALMFTFSI